MSTEAIQLPDIFGNEEETGLISAVNNQTVWQEPVDLLGNLDQYLPEEFKPTVNGFLPNSFLIYCGGSSEGGLANLERATPEVANIDEFIRYKNASRIILLSLVSDYTVEMSKKHGIAKTRIQQRVVDSGYYNAATRKACHDNFGRSDNGNVCLPLEKSKDKYTDTLRVNSKAAQQTLATFLATRNFVTGAGYVHQDGLDYSQKVGGLEVVDGYGYHGSMYRTTNAKHDGGNRVEIRCSDINLREWAVKQRIGMSALMLALLQTPLIDELPQLADSSNSIAMAKNGNKIKLTPDRTIQPTPELKMAMYFQQELAYLVLGKLGIYIEEIPDIYYKLAQDLERYCDNFMEVLQGDRQIDDLADRADWADKMHVIHKHVERDKKYGITRSMTDIQSQQLDMQYDYIGVQAKNGQPAQVKWGYGHRRNKHHTPSAHDMAATKTGSPNTRAGLRSKILNRYDVLECDWSDIVLASGEEISLMPGQTELTPAQEELLYLG